MEKKREHSGNRGKNWRYVLPVLGLVAALSAAGWLWAWGDGRDSGDGKEPEAGGGAIGDAGRGSGMGEQGDGKGASEKSGGGTDKGARGNSGESTSGEGSLSWEDSPESQVKIWSTYSTATVFQDPEVENASCPVEQEAKLEIRMAKGETEGDQLILTPQADVGEYFLTLSELACGENRIPLEQIRAYKQGYVYVDREDTGFPAAKYPDILLPMEVAAEYGENTIAAGQNQGITVEVTTDSNTEPGTYTGTFFLDVDGLRTEIPVEVTVWDIDITKSHLRSVAVAKYDTMQRGGEASSEQIRRYYETLLDYRVQVTDMPFATASPVRFRRELLRYYDHPRVNSIGLPDSVGLFEQCLLEAARLSAPGKLYTDKLVCYDKNRDESDNPGQVMEAAMKYRQAMERVIAALEQDGFFDQPGFGGIGGEFYQELTDSIRDVKLIYTVGYNPAFAEYGITYCMARTGGNSSKLPVYGPVYNYGNAEFAAYREYYRDSGEWLHYINGEGPMISSGLPNWGSALRYWGYAMYNMGTAGELTWGVTLYSVLNGTADIQLYPRNWYEEGLSFPSLKLYMDGFYVYPGSGYGMDTFIPSVRLAARRDGFEDYELLWQLQELYRGTLEEVWGADYDMNDVLDWVLRKAVADWRYYPGDDGLLFEMRETIVSLIELAKSDCGFVFGGIAFDGEQPNQGTMEFWVRDGYEVSMDGAVLEREDGMGEFGAGESETGEPEAVLSGSGKSKTEKSGTGEFGTGQAKTRKSDKVRYRVARDGNTANDFSIEIRKETGGEEYVFAGRMLRDRVHIGMNGQDGELSPAYTSSAAGQFLEGTAARFRFDGAQARSQEEIRLLDRNMIQLDDSYFDCRLGEIYDVTMTVELETSDADKDTDLLLEIYLATDMGYKSEMEIVNLKANGTTRRRLTYTFHMDEKRGDCLLFEWQPYYDYSIYAADYDSDRTGKYEGDGKYHVYGDITLDITSVSWTK